MTESRSTSGAAFLRPKKSVGLKAEIPGRAAYPLTAILTLIALDGKVSATANAATPTARPPEEIEWQASLFSLSRLINFT